jgi:hypothetical protein
VLSRQLRWIGELLYVNVIANRSTKHPNLEKH